MGDAMVTVLTSIGAMRAPSAVLVRTADLYFKLIRAES